MGSTRAAVLKFLRNANPYVGLLGGSRYGTRLLRTALAVMLARLSLMAIAHSEVPGPRACKLFASHLSERRARQPLCNGMCEAGRHNDSGTALPIQDVPAFRSSDVPTTLIEAHRWQGDSSLAKARPAVPARSPGPDRPGAAPLLECSGIRRHAAFGCWQGNGINLAMLSTARHENSPPPTQ